MITKKEVLAIFISTSKFLDNPLYLLLSDVAKVNRSFTFKVLLVELDLWICPFNFEEFFFT